VEGLDVTRFEQVNEIAALQTEPMKYDISSYIIFHWTEVTELMLSQQ